MAQKQSSHKTLIQLGILGFFTIAGLVLMLRTSQQIDAELTMAEIHQARSPFTAPDFNPCIDVKCGPGGHAQFIGDNIQPTTGSGYVGGMLCECPNGKILQTRAYTHGPSLPK